MAESAANFTATSQAKPSIFEVIAQKSLNATLHPAGQKLALFLAACNPPKLNWVCKYYEESFLVLNGLLQFHYLRHYDASFAEYFYGLQRASIKDQKLNKALSFSVLVLLPYAKRKLEDRLAVYRMENAEGYLRNNFKDRLKKFLLLSQSAFELSWSTWTVVQYLKYMSEQSESQSPGLKLLNLKLVYATEQLDLASFWSALFKGQLSFKELSVGLLQNGISTVLELSAFFVQFLNAWYAERPNYDMTALPGTSPPPVHRSANDYKGKCPICLQSWKIPTVLPVSGFVFCFPCILRYLREHSKCPVTNYPARPLDIIRLYDSE